jgi:hypothetical protein
MRHPWPEACALFGRPHWIGLGLHMFGLVRLINLAGQFCAEVVMLTDRHRGQLWQAIRPRQRMRNLPWPYE